MPNFLCHYNPQFTFFKPFSLQNRKKYYKNGSYVCCLEHEKRSLKENAFNVVITETDSREDVLEKIVQLLK